MVVVVRVLGVTQADPDDGRRLAGGARSRAQQLIQSVQVVQTSDLTNTVTVTTHSTSTTLPALTPTFRLFFPRESLTFAALILTAGL